MEGFKIMIIELMMFMLQMNAFYISIYINTVQTNDEHPGSKMTLMFHIIEQTRL